MRSAMTKTAVVTVLAAGLVLTGCSSAASSGGSEDSDHPQLKARTGLVVSDPDLDLENEDEDGLDLDDDGTLIVPSGRLDVSRVLSVDEIPKRVVADVDVARSPGATTAPSGSASTMLQPAEGEHFVAVSVSYAQRAGVDDDVSDPKLELDIDGRSKSLTSFDADEHRTYLFSLPNDGDAALTLSQEGHPQSIDLSNGDRIDDSVAATYYRDNVDVDVDDTLIFPTKTLDFSDHVKGDISEKFNLETEVDQASLRPWVPGQGWADEDQAWLVLDGTATSTKHGGVKVDVKTTETVSVAVGDGVEQTFAVKLKGETTSTEFHKVIQVPMSIGDVDMAAQATVDLTETGDWPLVTSSPLKISSDTIEFSIGESD